MASNHLVSPAVRPHTKRIRAKEAKRQLGIDEHEHVHLFFGLIRPYKGLHVLLEAMDHLPKGHTLVVAENATDPGGPMPKSSTD